MTCLTITCSPNLIYYNHQTFLTSRKRTFVRIYLCLIIILYTIIEIKSFSNKISFNINSRFFYSLNSFKYKYTGISNFSIGTIIYYLFVFFFLIKLQWYFRTLVLWLGRWFVCNCIFNLLDLKRSLIHSNPCTTYFVPKY